MALLSGMVLNTYAASVQTSDSGASPALSAANRVPDFYAEGTSGSYSLKISPKGGYLESGGRAIFLMPWGYVTAQWTIGTVYIIFLANVTESNFQIAFLYITNSSTPFILRTFDYEDASINSMTFSGIQYVFARLTVASQSPLPQLKLVPKAKSGSDLSVIGPELYLNGNYGLLLNDTRTLRIFPLKVQLFAGPDDYNEVWSLLTDSSGNFYFAILYMQNSNHNLVTVEHQLRLNDYKKLDGRTLEAKWMSNPFTSRVTVRLPIANTTVRVDGFPFRTDSKGIASVYVPPGSTSIEVPNDITPTQDTRFHFSSWKNHGSANPVSVEVDSSLELTANYARQYLLTIESEYGEPQGSG